MALVFDKYHGIGNDFIVVNKGNLSKEMDAVWAQALCDRHTGIGADGVIVVEGATDGYAMRVYNADGSIPEMCGNGIRCVALHLSRAGVFDDSIEIGTDAGPHLIQRVRGEQDWFEVTMRIPSLVPGDIPLGSEHPWIDQSLSVGDRELQLTAVSMGNPHVVSFDQVGDARLRLAPQLASDSVFTEGVNVGFATIKGPQHLCLHVYERGSGWTQACGTGACAAAVAAIRTKRATSGSPIEVDLPGGCLRISIGSETDPVKMAGPAKHVFSGTFITQSVTY